MKFLLDGNTLVNFARVMEVNKIINKVILLAEKKLLREIECSRKNPLPFQREVFNHLIECGKDTLFGIEHKYSHIKDYKSFQQNVPISDYNGLSSYVNRARSGEDYILWNQKVKWFAKSSGTSSDKSKFIPVTEESLKQMHFKGMTSMIVNYLNNYPDSKLFSGKALTLGGSVRPDEMGNGVSQYGDLSAVMLKNTPAIVELARTPKRSTALIADFNQKVEKICKESSRQNVTNFSGVPSWNLILLNKILEYNGKENLLELWPNLELFMHGGIGFEPYRPLYEKIIPKDNMHYLENYNASEGYFAFQDDPSVDAMLLTVNNGVFYEFVPMEYLHEALQGDNSHVVDLEGVKINIDYAIIITTNGGLWRYLPEDCVKFVSLSPRRIKVTGRTKMYINAFGEEMMIDNAEKALSAACKKCDCSIRAFTVAPVFMDLHRKGYHTWAIEFAKKPADLQNFEKTLDVELTKVNSDYEAKRAGDATMQQLKVLQLKDNTFVRWMESRGKLGGQNKVPSLWKDQTFINQLKELQ